MGCHDDVSGVVRSPSRFYAWLHNPVSIRDKDNQRLLTLIRDSLTGIVKSFDRLSGRGSSPLLMVEKTFCFTFQPLIPTSQNYLFQGAASNFVGSMVPVVLWLRISISPEFECLKINRLKINYM